MRLSDISITRMHDGSLELATMHAGFRVHYRYYGYTRKQALNLFRMHLINVDRGGN